MNEKGIKMNSEQFFKELMDRGEKHNSYKYYAKEEYVSQIIQDGVLYLSDGGLWNDKADSARFSSNHRFAKSFSFLKKENVSMWMLYADQCLGCMIDFTNKQIREIIEFNRGKRTDVYKIENGQFNYISSAAIADILLIDIGYESTKKEDYVNLYRADSYYKVTGLDENRPFFIKNYAWKNESECRLVVETKEQFNEKGFFIKLIIPDNVKNKLANRIIAGPSNKNSPYHNSELHDKVSWKV